ncbi:MAG: BREX-3 system P-loop-containing protein BrxF [Candidatus Bipolaricaulia bacterium]
MPEPLVDEIVLKIDQADKLFYRLVLVVAPSGSGKTTALREVARRTKFPYINVNLELSQRLLPLTERQRLLRVFRLLSEIVEGYSKAVILDNLEMLFDVSLKQDPLRLLQEISRNKTVIAAWNGSIEKDYLTYATPDHPEYRRYPVRDFLVAGAEVTT